jgi:hypothetical protein
MPAGRFGLYTTLGCIPWTAALAIAGYALGANWEHVADDFHGPSYAIAGIIAVALASVVVLHFYRRRRRNADATATPPEPAQPAGHPTAHPDLRGQAPDPRAFTGRPPDRAFTGQPPDRAFTGQPPDRAFTGQPPDRAYTGQPHDRAYTSQPHDAEASGHQWPVPSDRRSR